MKLTKKKLTASEAARYARVSAEMLDQIQTADCTPLSRSSYKNAVCRALVLLLSEHEIEQCESGYEVASENEEGVIYTVARHAHGLACSCPAGQSAKVCKHKAAAAILDSAGNITDKI